MMGKGRRISARLPMPASVFTALGTLLAGAENAVVMGAITLLMLALVIAAVRIRWALRRLFSLCRKTIC